MEILATPNSASDTSSGTIQLTLHGHRPHGDRRQNALQAEEETHFISSLQLGVKLAEDLLQLFPDHIGENIQASPAKARPLLATSSTSLASSADSDLPSPRHTEAMRQPHTSSDGCRVTQGGGSAVSPEETADPSAQGWTSCCHIPTAAPERAGRILRWDSSSAG